MQESINQTQTAVVCIDSYENLVLSGRIFNPQSNTDITFRSTMEFLKKTQSMLSENQSPQPFSENRAFRPCAEVTMESTGVSCNQKGTVATFFLRVLFRKNTSWQGSLVWIDGKLEKRFRSVLELLMLIDSAIAS